MFDKDEKDDNVKGFFDREEKEQNFADIIKILIDLSGNSTRSDLNLSKFHCIVGNNWNKFKSRVHDILRLNDIAKEKSMLGKRE